MGIEEKSTLISGTDRELLHDIKDLVQRFLPAATVLLYGSVARGTRTTESDYDILVLTDGALTSREEQDLDAALFDLGLDRDAVICAIFHTKAEWERPPLSGSPFHENVEQDAILL